MSFSSDVKDELSKHFAHKSHCHIAEAAAIFAACGEIEENGDEYTATIRIENHFVAHKYGLLLVKAFNVIPEGSIGRIPGQRRHSTYMVSVKGQDAVTVLTGFMMLDSKGQVRSQNGVCEPGVYRRPCCKRAFIRGAFLASGSISNPEKAYHYELVCQTRERADQLKEILFVEFDIDAKVVCRKKHHVVYVKEGSQLVDLLNVMEAHNALMELENVRIIREISGTVNRKVNCETANINKTVSAAVEQINDIVFLRDRVGFDQLPEGVAAVALARLAKPEASLKELGEMLDPPIGKSGVNHRLRKIKELASSFRENEEEKL